MDRVKNIYISKNIILAIQTHGHDSYIDTDMVMSKYCSQMLDLENEDRWVKDLCGIPTLPIHLVQYNSAIRALTFA